MTSVSARARQDPFPLGVEHGLPASADALSQLTASLADVSFAEHDLVGASLDRSGVSGHGVPVALVRAHSVDEVRHVAAWCTRTGTPLVPRGTGTGLAGAAAAGRGVIVLDLSRMNRILEIDSLDQVAVVEPGVITAVLDAAAAGQGLMYAPDPGSYDISTLGGNIATNAGGLRAAKYGVTREAVLGLDVVLADGRLISIGRRTVKGVTGYDLVALFVGSQGTLGVVVRATLRLLPRPTQVATVAATFASFEAAAGAASALSAAGLRPLLCEAMDGPTVRAIDAATGSDLSSRGEAFLLVQTDGPGAQVECDGVLAVLQPLATSVEATTDPGEGERLVALRRALLPSIEASTRGRARLLIEDIAVPRSQLARAAASIAEISRETGVPIYTAAHAGDGNLHPIIVLEDDAGRPDPQTPALSTGGASSALPPRAQEAADRIFALALSLRGTVTGEHGVGTLKREHAIAELGEDVVALQRQLKAFFDPAGVLNPAVVL